MTPKRRTATYTVQEIKLLKMRIKKLMRSLLDLSSEMLECGLLHDACCCIHEAGVNEVADDALKADDELSKELLKKNRKAKRGKK